MHSGVVGRRRPVGLRLILDLAERRIGAFGRRENVLEVARRPPFTGVWSGERKLGAIGVKLAGGVTTHGVALNVATDLSWFDRVTPCGIEGASVASLESLGASGHTPAEVAPVLAAGLASAFGCRLDTAGPLAATVHPAAREATAAA